MSLRNSIRAATMRSPTLDKWIRWILGVIRQCPIWRPAGIIKSAHDWVDKYNTNLSWHGRHKGAWSRIIYPGAVRTYPPVKPRTAYERWPFRNEFIQTVSEARLYHLPEAFLFGDSGAVISKENRIFDEFYHDFDTSCTTYYRPFGMFAWNVPRRAEWIALLCAPSASFNYYHWLFDSLPRIHLLEWLRPYLELYAVPAALDPVRYETLDLLGISREQLLLLQPNDKVFCEHLAVPSLPGSLGAVPDWAIRFLQKSFLSAIDDLPRRRQQTYLVRGSLPLRPVLNEEAVIDIMRDRGFEIVQTDKLSFLEQVRLFRDSEIIVSPHGAALANLVFCENASVLEFFSPGYFRPDSYYTLATQLSLPYHFQVSPVPERRDPLASQRVNIDELRRNLDHMQASQLCASQRNLGS